MKEETKTLDFQQHIGGMADCMNIIMKATKGCGQISSNYTFFSIRWLCGVKTAKEVD